MFFQSLLMPDSAVLKGNSLPKATSLSTLPLGNSFSATDDKSSASQAFGITQDFVH